MFVFLWMKFVNLGLDKEMKKNILNKIELKNLIEKEQKIKNNLQR